MNINVEFNETPMRGIPIPLTATDVTVLTGPGVLYGWSIREASGDTAQTVENSAVAPVAGATIASISGILAGTYNVTWTVELLGAAAAGDQNNFQLTVSGNPNVVSLNNGAAGQYAQINEQVVLAAGSVVSVKAVGAGTAGVTYAVQLSVTPVVQYEAVVEIQDGGQPLAELSMQVNSTNSEAIGAPGLTISNQIKIHVVAGIVTGVVYAVFDKW